MKVIHRICARPYAICWILGTLFLWVLTTLAFWSGGVFAAAGSDLSSVLRLLVVYAGLVGLGFFVGVMSLFSLVVRACRWVNGGPYVVGDHVTILMGPNAGITTTVYELTRGQGGELLPSVELGAAAREKYLDLFQDYALLRASGNATPLRDEPSEASVG